MLSIEWTTRYLPISMTTKMTDTPKTPAQMLAERITARLVGEKLLGADRAVRFCASLAAGKLKTGDWRLAIEAVKPTSKPATQ